MGTSLKFGLICGLLTCLWVISEFMLGLHNEHYQVGKYTGYFALIIPLITLYIGLKEKRSDDLDMRFSTLFSSGIIMVLTSAAIISCFFWIYNNYINEGWMQDIMESEAERMFNAGESPASITAMVEEYKLMSSDSYQFLISFGGSLLMGSAIAFIYALMLSKKDVSYKKT